MQDFCIAYQSTNVYAFPVRSKKIKIKDRFLHFLMIETEHGICIGKRKSGIWRGLYEFPFFEFSENLSESKVIKMMFGKNYLENIILKLN